MTFTSELYASIALVLVILWYLTFKNKQNKHYKNIPSPPSLPILGHALELRCLTTLLDVLLNYQHKFGGLVKVNIGPLKTMLLVTDYKLSEFIMSSPKMIHKSLEYSFLRPWLGNGLLTSSGPQWKKHRRILTPTFHFQILEQFIEVFEATGKTLVTKLQQEVAKDSVDIYPFVTLCTLDIICETAMGTVIDAQNNSDSAYVQSVKNFCRIFIERSVSPLEMYDLLFPLTRNYYSQRKSLKVLHDYANQVIEKRAEELKRCRQSQSSAAGGPKRRKAFLDFLLEAAMEDNTITLQQVADEVNTFMFEGHDTTGSAISFALFSLANNLEVQNKVLDEQNNLFGSDPDPSVTYSDLQNMKYLDQVIKETLRLYPSVPLFGRQPNEEVVFEGTTFPAGSTILVFPYGIHRNPEYYKDPHTFNPSRFDEIDGKFPYAYIPFSAGPRNCIGQKFAVLEMKSTLSKIIRNLELIPATPHHELLLSPETVLKSKNGFRIGMKIRVK